MATNEQVLTALKELKGNVEKFTEQYELDMRGDKDLSNGNKGMVGEIREIKKYIHDFPSLTYLFYKYPLRVVGVGIGVFLVFMTLYSLGLLKVLGAMIGVPLP